MSSFEALAKRRNIVEQHPSPETPAAARERASESDPQERRAQNIENFLANARATYDSTRSENTTFLKMMGKRILAGAAAGMFLFSPGEARAAEQPTDTAASRRASETVPPGLSDISKHSYLDAFPRAPITGAKAQEIQDYYFDVTRHSFYIPREIKELMSPDEEDALRQRGQQLRRETFLELHSSSSEHPEKTFRQRQGQDEETSFDETPEQTSARVKRAEALLREQLLNQLPDNVRTQVDPTVLNTFLDDASRASELAHDSRLDSEEQKLLSVRVDEESDRPVALRTNVGTSFHRNVTSESAQESLRLDDATIGLGIHFSGDLNELFDPQTDIGKKLYESLSAEWQSYKKSPVKRVAGEILSWSIK